MPRGVYIVQNTMARGGEKWCREIKMKNEAVGNKMKRGKEKEEKERGE